VYKLRVYFASGWFTPNQKSTYDRCLVALKEFGDKLDCYIPKEGSADLQGSINDPQARLEIFRRNIEAIKSADFLVVSTEDKDPGSLFEAGYAHRLQKPIVYVNLHLGDGVFNLMLTESAIAIATSMVGLLDILSIITTQGLDSSELAKFREQSKVE